MSPRASLEIVGIKEALRDINKVSPTLRRQITKDYKEIVAPVIQDARERNPQDPPLSGFVRKWTTKSGLEMFPWDAKKSDRGIAAGTSGKKPKLYNGMTQNLAAFFIRWKGPQSTLFEMATKGNLGGNLDAKFGFPGRVIWKSWDAHQDEVMRKMEELVDGIMKAADKAQRSLPK
jgi:hypothetical protein